MNDGSPRMSDGSPRVSDGRVPSPARRDPGLWQHRNFMTLWAGQALNETGSAVSSIAVPLTAVAVLNASTLAVGLLQAAQMAPYLLVALPAGMAVDRLRKRRLMVLCDVVSAVLMATIPVAYLLGLLTMAQLWAVALLCGVTSVFFDVAYQCYVAMLVRPEQLMDANGKLSTSYGVSEVTGIGAGGVLASAVGAARAVGLDAASFIVGAVSLLLIRHHETRPSRPARAGRQRLRGEFTAGLAFVARDRVLRKIVAATTTLNVFSQMIYALSVIYLVRVLHLGSAMVALQLALGAAGAILGGAVAGRLSGWVGTARIIWVSLLGLSWTMLLVPLARPGGSVVLYSIGMSGFAASCSIYNAAQVSYRTRVCPPEMLGRMTAAIRWIIWGALPIGALLGGLLGTHLGIRDTLWIAAAGVWASGFLVLFSPLRAMRDFDHGPAPVTAIETEDSPPSDLASAPGGPRS
jgi:MFS family permease